MLDRVLDQLHEKHKITTIIHGNARGADTLSGLWAKKNKINAQIFPAQWSKYGRAAGPIRNQHMLSESQPDLVVAFPGGKGTQNMVQISKKNGTRVIDVGDFIQNSG